MKRFALFLWTLCLAALGWVLWQRRDDLKRSYGEWRAATDAVGGGGRAGQGAHEDATAGPTKGPRVNGPVPASPPPAPSPPAAGPARCAATTGSGKRCTRLSEEGSRFCWQHAD